MCLLLCIISVLFILINLLTGSTNKHKEPFNEQVGKYCHRCDSYTTMNQCLQCFNCGWLLNKNSDAICVKGDHTGPYESHNKQNMLKWYHTDPWLTMTQRNDNYRCSYGPSSANRVI